MGNSVSINLAIPFKESEIPSLLVVSRKLGCQASRVPKDVSFVGLEKSSFFDLKAFFKLIKVIRSFKPDLIHAHSTSLYWAVLVKFLFPKLKLIWAFDGARRATTENRKGIQ